MPYCRHCHQEISKFDTDICPRCGGARPIAQGYKTMDVTRNFATVSGEQYSMPKTRSQKTFSLLCMLLGYFGVHEFYIYRKSRAIAIIFITLAFVGGVGSLLFFLTPLHNVLAYLLPFLVLWVIYIVLGIFYRKVEAPKDGKGEFLR